MSQIRRSLLTITLALLPGAVIAQDFVVWHGGISEEERQLAPESGTRFVFFVSGGNFLSDVKVIVTDSSGAEVVNVTTDGPWLYLNLPTGTYSVEAIRSNGDTQSLKIEIGTNPNQEFGFMFPGS